MEKSTHRTEVVEINLKPCPNSDSLSLCEVWGYQVILKTEDWKDIKLGAYVVPDSLVPNTGPFKFLFKPDDAETNKHRVRIIKLRGNLSMGLMVPAPIGSKLGDDVSKKLGVTRYEPPVKGCSTQNKKRKPYWYEPVITFLIKGVNRLGINTYVLERTLARKGIMVGPNRCKPDLLAPEYDVDALLRYPNLFTNDEIAIVTEKIHGMNTRYVYYGGKYFVGSHHTWVSEFPENPWWKVLKDNEKLMKWLYDHPGYIVYGEIYGQAQAADGFDYGLKNINKFRAFNIQYQGRWLDYQEARDIGTEFDWVPEITRIFFSLEKMKELAEGNSLIPGANHIREGIVIVPEIERTDPRIGRVCLKLVSNAYLLKKDKTK